MDRHEGTARTIEVDGRPGLKLPCTFGGASKGKTAASIGVGFDRSQISLEQLNRLVIGSRLQVTMGIDPNADGDDPDELLIDTLQHKISGVADYHRASVGKDAISGRLSFNADDVSLDDLGHLAGGTGVISLVRLGSAGDEPAGAAAEGPEDDTDPLFDDEGNDAAWRGVSLDDLGILGNPAEALAEHGLSTLGEITDWVAAGNNLSDIKGIGPTAAGKIEAKLDDYWRAHPIQGEAPSDAA